MSRFVPLAFTSILVFGSVALADDTARKEVIRDDWSLMRLNGADSGWTSTKVTRVEENGVVRYQSETASKIVMKRFGQTMNIAAGGTSIEDADGRLIGLTQSSKMSGRETTFKLVVEGTKATLTIVTMGKPRTLNLAWSKDVLGPVGVQKRMASEGLEPGNTYSFKTFTADQGKVMTVTIKVEGVEETTLLGKKTERLCRLTSTNDVMPGLKSKVWCAADFVEAKTSMTMMGMKIETYRTTKQRATKPPGTQAAEVFNEKSMAYSNVNLPSPYRLDSIKYEFKARDKALGIPKGLADDRQKVLSNEGGVAIVKISARVPSKPQTRPLADPKPELADYLAPNAFLQSDHEALKVKAHAVIGDETDAWKAATKLEAWVYAHISDKGFGTGFASAAEVFENKTGDCSEHGVLLAAACRAVGIPARVALGYMYLGGVFAGHMWAEVWINGTWYPVDGVMGIGRVDPTHIRFSTSSLKGGGLGTAFAAALQGLGNLDIKILEFTRGDKTVKVGAGFKDHTVDGDTYLNTLRNVRLTKPAGTTFDVKTPKGLSFELLEIKGTHPLRFGAEPAAFSFTWATYTKRLKARFGQRLTVTKRTIDKRPARLYEATANGQTLQLLAVLDTDTCYVLAGPTPTPAAKAAFEAVAKSISFPN